MDQPRGQTSEQQIESLKLSAFLPGLFLQSIGSIGFVSLAALFLNFLLARFLEVADVGHLRLIRTVLDFTVLPASLGMGACIARHVADDRVRDNERSRMLRTGLTLGLLCASTVALLGALTFQFPGILRDAIARNYLKWMILLIIPVALFNGLRGYLQGMGFIRKLALAQSFRSAVLLTSGAALGYSMGLRGWALAVGITEIAALIIALRVTGALSLGSFDRALVGTFVGFGAYSALTQTLAALIGTLDILTLDHSGATPAQVAQYGMGMLMFNAALLLPNAFVQSHFSRMSARAYDGRETWNLLVRYSGFVLLLALPASFIAWFAAPLVGILLGKNYIFSGEVFRWLIPAFVIQSAGLVAGSFVVASGRVRDLLIANASAAAINLILNILLIHRLGVAGAVISTTATYAFLTLVGWFVLRLHRLQDSTDLSPSPIE